jgi:hypothetical protein
MPADFGEHSFDTQLGQHFCSNGVARTLLFVPRRAEVVDGVQVGRLGDVDYSDRGRVRPLSGQGLFRLWPFRN